MKYAFSLIVLVMVTMSCAVAQEAPAYKVTLDELRLLEPFWSSQQIQGESLFFVQENDGELPFAHLFFVPSEIKQMRSTNRSATFETGKDYTVISGTNRVELTKDSRIPFMKMSELFPNAGSPNSYAHKKDDAETNLYYSPTQFALNQVEVDYDRLSGESPQQSSGSSQPPGQWQGYVPKYAGDNLPHTMQKLKNKEPLTITFFGDSITDGWDSSEKHNIAPFQPAYPKLMVEALQKHFGANITMHNLAVSGMTSAWGAENAKKVVETSPDLCVIAFGMNDVNWRNPEAFKANIDQIIKAVRTANPNAEFVLVASMLGNCAWKHVPEEMFPAYRDVLKELCDSGIVLADLTEMWQDMLKIKRFYDLCGNGLNHPNDFGFRVYAQVLLAMLIEKK